MIPIFSPFVNQNLPYFPNLKGWWEADRVYGYPSTILNAATLDIIYDNSGNNRHGRTTSNQAVWSSASPLFNNMPVMNPALNTVNYPIPGWTNVDTRACSLLVVCRPPNTTVVKKALNITSGGTPQIYCEFGATPFISFRMPSGASTVVTHTGQAYVQDVTYLAEFYGSSAGMYTVLNGSVSSTTALATTYLMPTQVGTLANAPGGTQSLRRWAAILYYDRLLTSAEQLIAREYFRVKYAIF